MPGRQVTRNSERKLSFLAAFATAEAGGEAVFCIVRDLTPTGARLDVAPTAALPDCFDLQIAGRERIWRAHVSWRLPSGLGVRLSRPPSSAERAVHDCSSTDTPVSTALP